MTLRELYTQGLTFLRDVLNYLPDKQIEDEIFHLLFDNKFTQFKMNFYLGYTKNANLLGIMRNVVNILAEYTSATGEVLPFHFELFNNTEVASNYYITTTLSVEKGSPDATIYLKSIQIPLHQKCNISEGKPYSLYHIKHTLESAIYRKWDKQKVIFELIRDSTLTFIKPLGEHPPYLLIDPAGEIRKTPFLLGSFTTTKTTRTTLIGSRIYLEFFYFDKYYKINVDLSAQGGVGKYINYFIKYPVTSCDHTYLEEFIKSKEECLL